MSTRRIAALGLFSGICLATIAGAFAQPAATSGADKPDAPKPALAPDQLAPEALMRKIEEQSRPVAAHNALSAFDGTWTTEYTIFLGATKPITSRGSSTHAWILGKRFMQIGTKIGDVAGVNSESLSLYGYDTRVAKYTLTSVDTFGTYGIFAQGDYDAATKTLTLVGTDDESGRPMDFKWVVKFESADRIVQQVLLSLPDDSAPAEGHEGGAAAPAAKEPEWFKMSETIYTRQK